ncbi:MAG: putative lipoic acid-binding regulatory protein [Oceanicoccus sp.]|jgi:putative lipoic acid-binding regulatory protein
MSEQEPPKIEFPCDYPIKVLGRQTDDFEAVVVAVMEQHAGAIAAENVKLRPSGKGTFVAVTVTIIATGAEQLEAIHKDLLATGRVQMVM